MKIVILGAGIAGISAAYHGRQVGFSNIQVYEQSNKIGGLVDNFVIDGFRFDYAIHLSFTKNDYVRNLFNRVPYYNHQPISYNFDNGVWLKHPVQNNLFPLTVEEKVKAINSFLNRPSFKDGNYKEWLISQYGEYLAEKYPIRYTRKYWATEPEKLSIDWVGNRFADLTLEKILQGAISDKTPNYYYADEMRYPQKGGYKSFIQPIINEIIDTIILNKKVVFIDEKKKEIEFEDGSKESYDVLISSIPLPLLSQYLNYMPVDLKSLAKELKATSIGLVSLGFNKVIDIQYLWFYIYDEDIMPARVYSPSIKSMDNVPKGCSSLQFEIYFDGDSKIKDGEKIISNVIDKLDRLGINKKDVVVSDYREVKYGNIIFYNGMREKRNLLKNYFKDKDIYLIGRFGEWDYLWSDEAFITGEKAISNLLKNYNLDSKNARNKIGENNINLP